MRRFSMLALCCVFAVGCGGGEEQAGSSTPATQVVHNTPHGDLVVGEPVRHGNLTIFPIVSSEPRNDDRFITLDEGLKAGTIEVRELGGGNDSPANPPGNSPGNSGGQAPELEPAEAAPAGQAEEQATREPVLEASPQPPVQSLGNASVQSVADESFEPVDAPHSDEPSIDAQIEEGLQQLAEQAPAGSDEVNRLAVVNSSGKPLYLMPGEVIVGGNQDRTIAEEFVIAPTGQPVEIDAYCVEHGRWADRGFEHNCNLVTELAVAQGLEAKPEDVKKLAKAADEGKFVISAGNLDSKGRLAVQDKASGETAPNQSEVWDSVAQANATLGVQSQSGAYTENYTEDDVVKNLQPYLDQLQGPIGDTPQIIGAAVAVNGKIVAVDVFESTPLFKKLWPKLLRSYSLEALHATQVDAGNVALTCPSDAARSFLSETFNAKVEGEETRQGVCTTRRKSENVAVFSASVMPVDGQPAPSAGKGGQGGVHTSAFAH